MNGRQEMDRWIEAVLRLEDSIGTIFVGKKANLLVLESNPLESVQAYDSIVKVILNGKVLPRQGLAAQ